MWARVVELILACWLGGSSLVFSQASQHAELWVSDLTCAVLLASAAIMSYHPTWRRAHLLQFAIAGWLIGFALLALDATSDPAAQNYILVGLVLMILGIVPCRASEPPRAWREFREREARHRPSKPCKTLKPTT